MGIAEQIDWITIDDKRAALRKLLSDGAEEVGIVELSHWLNEDPSTLRNQLAHRERKRPSAELEHIVYLTNARYRQRKAGQCGEVLSIVPNLTEAEALRLIVAKAESSWGKHALSEVASIVSRVGTSEDTWERRAIDAGWSPPR